MLEYGLVPAGDGRRWFIRKSISGEYRYLHLEKKRLWWWKTVHKKMISPSDTDYHGFEAATRAAARGVMRELEVNFNRPTGEVR